MRCSLSLSVLPLIAGLVTTSPGNLQTTTTSDNLASIISAAHSKTIPGAYVIVFKDHVTVPEAVAHQEWVKALHLATTTTKARSQRQSYLNKEATIYQGLKHQYDIPGRILGYSGHFDEDVLHELRRHPDVSFLLSHPKKFYLSVYSSTLSPPISYYVGRFVLYPPMYIDAKIV